MQQVWFCLQQIYNVIFSSVSEISFERDQLLHSQKIILPKGEFVYMPLLKYEFILFYDYFAKQRIH